MNKRQRRQKNKNRRDAAKQRLQNAAVVSPEPTEVIGNAIEQSHPTATTKKSEEDEDKDMANDTGVSAWIQKHTNTVIAVFTIVIAVIAGIQACIYSSQLDEMRIDQRAWVNVQITGINFKVNETLNATMKVVNTGKTPAKKVDGWIIIHSNPMGTAIDFSDPTKAEKLPPKGQNMTYTRFVAPVLFPQDPVEFKGASLLVVDNGVPHRQTWTQAMQDDWDHGKAYFEIHGEFPYIDAAGNSHWTRFCRTESSGIEEVPYDISMSCNKYADVDNNK